MAIRSGSERSHEGQCRRRVRSRKGVEDGLMQSTVRRPREPDGRPISEVVVSLSVAGIELHVLERR